MGLLGLYMGKVTWVLKKLVGSTVFLKLVRPLVFSDPACAEYRVVNSTYHIIVHPGAQTEHSGFTDDVIGSDWFPASD